MKDFMLLFISPRFWGAYLILFLPVNIGIVMVGTVYAKEKLNDYIRRFKKGERFNRYHRN